MEHQPGDVEVRVADLLRRDREQVLGSGYPPCSAGSRRGSRARRATSPTVRRCRSGRVGSEGAREPGYPSRAATAAARSSSTRLSSVIRTPARIARSSSASSFIGPLSEIRSGSVPVRSAASSSFGPNTSQPGSLLGEDPPQRQGRVRLDRRQEQERARPAAGERVDEPPGVAAQLVLRYDVQRRPEAPRELLRRAVLDVQAIHRGSKGNRRAGGRRSSSGPGGRDARRASFERQLCQALAGLRSELKPLAVARRADHDPARDARSRSARRGVRVHAGLDLARFGADQVAVAIAHPVADAVDRGRVRVPAGHARGRRSDLERETPPSARAPDPSTRTAHLPRTRSARPVSRIDPQARSRRPIEARRSPAARSRRRPAERRSTGPAATTAAEQLHRRRSVSTTIASSRSVSDSTRSPTCSSAPAARAKPSRAALARSARRTPASGW